MPDFEPNSIRSIRSNTVNIGGLDPIQGHDVGVWVEDLGRRQRPNILVGQFNAITILVKNSSTPYRRVGTRQAIYLDDEIQVSFTMEKGLLDALVFQETFGFKTLDFRNVYLRSPRLKITFAMDPVDWFAMDEATKVFGERVERRPAGRIILGHCKVDTWGLMAQAGKSVVANRWEGTAQIIGATAHTLSDMPASDQANFKGDGDPVDPRRSRTFLYVNDFADLASTYVEGTPLPTRTAPGNAGILVPGININNLPPIVSPGLPR